MSNCIFYPENNKQKENMSFSKKNLSLAETL